MILKLILQRIVTSLATLLFISVIIFTAVEILPGDVAARALGRFATEDAKRIFREQLHLDRPVPERYGLWLSGVLRGDFGRSIVNQIPVNEIVGPKLRNTLLLGAYGFLIYIPISVILATLAAVSRDGPLDAVITLATLVGLECATPGRHQGISKPVACAVSSMAMMRSVTAWWMSVRDLVLA